MFQIEAPDVGAPEEIQIRRRPLRPVPPQPKDARLAPTFASGQALDLDQDECAYHDGQWTAAAPSCVVVDLRMHLGPRPNAHGSVPGVLAMMLG